MKTIRFILDNYKTSVPGALALVSVLIYWAGYITTEQFNAGVGLLLTAGLLGAKDYDKK